jgi:hypothetical protein
LGRVLDAMERFHAARAAEHAHVLAHHALRAELWAAVGLLRGAGDCFPGLRPGSTGGE